MSSYAGLDAKEANQQLYNTSTAATDKQASQCGQALANLLMSNIERQDSLSSEDGDETATAKGGVTTVTSPRRLPNINRSPLRISPRRTQQPKRTKGGDCAGLSLGNSVEDNVQIGDPDTIEHKHSMRECQEAMGFDVKFKREDGTTDYELLELENIRIPDGENRSPRRASQRTTTMPSANQRRTTSAAAVQRTTTTSAAAVQQFTMATTNQHMTPRAVVPPQAALTSAAAAQQNTTPSAVAVQQVTIATTNQHMTPTAVVQPQPSLTSAVAAQENTTPSAAAAQQNTTAMANQHMTSSAAVPPPASSTKHASANHTPVTTTQVDAAMEARIRVQQTSPRIASVADSLTDAQRKAKRQGFVLASHLCRWVSDSPAVGDCAPYSADEKRVVEGKNGILFNYFPLCAIEKKETKSQYRTARKKHVEFLVKYYCRARQKKTKSGCQCMLYIARTRDAILAYERVDDNGIPFVHTDHDVFPIERTGRLASDIEAGKRAVYDEWSLSIQQKEFILNQIIGRNYAGNCQLIAEDMMAASASRNLRLTEAQVSDQSKFVERIRKFCCNCSNEMNECGSYLSDLLGGDMTAEDMKVAINMLAMDDTSGVKYEGENEFLKSKKFDTMLREIKVVDSDYGNKDNGYGDFTYILFEYRDAGERAAAAVQMYEDSQAQLETDFFKGVGEYASNHADSFYYTIH